MNRTYKTGLFIFLLLLAVITYLEASEPEPVNWSPSYAAKDKIPLGSFVLFESLKEQNFKLDKISVPPYEFISADPPEGVYFFLNDRLYFDDDELKRLFSWISEGNTAFLAAESFSSNLLDSLDLSTGISIPENGISSRPEIDLVNPQLKSTEPYTFNREIANHIFTSIDTVEHVVLGISRLSSDPPDPERSHPNFIKAAIGEGTIFINTMPAAFSNFFLLQDNNYQYAEKALGYLPSGNLLFWDQYYKSGKAFYTSPLYILLNDRALKWSYYFIIVGSILFIIFEGKRKQRSIPVIEPLKNQSVHFTRTIAGLYLERNAHTKIAAKKINLFLEYVRNEFRLPTMERNDDFLETLSAQSCNPVEKVRKLFLLIDHLEKKDQVTEEELLELNAAIMSFKTTNNGK